MNVLKISDGKLELRNPNGSFIRVIKTSGVLNSTMHTNGSLILLTTDKGCVELRKVSGVLIRTIVLFRARNASFSGDDVLITCSNGKMELRRQTGTLITTY